MSRIERIKNFGYVTKRVLIDNDLGVGEKALYSLLCSYADKYGVCNPGIERLSSELGVSGRTIIKYMGVLEKYGIILREKQQFKNTTKTRIVDYK
jgi:hypothetical protein